MVTSVAKAKSLVYLLTATAFAHNSRDALCETEAVV